MRGLGRPEDWILNIGSDRVCATRRMQWQTVATAVCGSANRAAPRPFRGHAKPETYWGQSRYRRRLR
jgi:hypothetical protein